MQKPFRKRTTKLHRWALPLFFVVITVGWLLAAYIFSEQYPYHGYTFPFDSWYFYDLAIGIGPGQTTSLLYWLIMVGPILLGYMIEGSDLAAILALYWQVAIVIAILAYSCYWPLRRGLPLWSDFIFAGLAAAVLYLLMPALLSPTPAVIKLVVLLLLVLKMIDALRNGAYGLRKGATLYGVLTILAVLVLLDANLIFLVIPTLAGMIVVAKRSWLKVFSLSLLMLVIVVVATFIVFPSAGLQGDPTLLAQSILSQLLQPWSIDAPYRGDNFIALMGWLLWALLVLLAVFAWLLVDAISTRAASKLILLIPHASLLLIAVLCIGMVQFDHYIWLFSYALGLCLPFFFVNAFIFDHDMSRSEILAKTLELRRSIPADKHQQRSAAAAKELLAKIRSIDPAAGFIGLYQATGSELSLGALQAELAAMGYKTAYPAYSRQHTLEFYTTLGVDDEQLLAALEGSSSTQNASDRRSSAIPTLDASDIAFLLVPAVAMDKDNYRLQIEPEAYDNYIKRLKLKTPVWLVGFSEQLVDSLPRRRSDRPATGRVIV